MKENYLAVGQHKETKKWHGMMYRYKPTPSGCDRWILWASTTEGFETEQQAADAINKAFPELPPAQPNTESIDESHAFQAGLYTSPKPLKGE